MEKNYFEELNNVDVNEHIEKKNGLSYLSWAYAWGELKKKHPDANYKVYENNEGWNYFTDGRTAWVKTGVIVNGIEHIEFLPVMDYRNKSIPLESITSFDVNKTIQRSLTKAVARHGLGLYIYAGEDLPETDDSFKKDISDERRKKTIEIKKELKEYQETDEGVLARFESAKAFIRKLPKINVSDEVLMKKINEVVESLKKKGMEKQFEEFNELVNSKMPKDDDVIPY